MIEIISCRTIPMSRAERTFRKLAKKLGRDPHDWYAFRNFFFRIAGFFDREFVFPEFWFAFCLRGVWFRSPKHGPGWAFLWIGSGLIDFVTDASGRTRGPIDIVPAWKLGSLRFYRLEKV